MENRAILLNIEMLCAADFFRVKLAHPKGFEPPTFGFEVQYLPLLLMKKPNALLGFVIMLHSYDYISLFVPFIDISVSFDDFFKRIAFVYDRFKMSCFK